MRFDINILWIDDTARWQKQQQELFELSIENYGLLTNIEYVENVELVIDKLEKESVGFKTYDIIFVDYNISNTLLGNQVIDKLRNENIDADILFYSAFENDIKKLIIQNDGTFEGIYIANRDNFEEKSVALYKKNIRHLLSLSNIRGFLADKTSENDYIVNSYILKKYNDLSPTAKINMSELIKEKVTIEKDKQDVKRNEYDKIMSNSELNINNLIKLPSYLLPLKVKYMIFEFMLHELGDSTFNQYTISEYLDKIVYKRNTVAHKKLDVCKKQKYIKHYDNIKQYETNQCPDNCAEHNDKRKISLEEWQEILRLTNEYSKLFNKISEELVHPCLIKV